MFLGFDGSEGEIEDAFKSVDTDHSGLIDVNEFVNAIRGERMLELSLGHVLKKMGVQYDSNADQFEAFQKSQARRRLLKQQWEQDISVMTKNIIGKLSLLSDMDIPEKDAEQEK